MSRAAHGLALLRAVVGAPALHSVLLRLTTSIQCAGKDVSQPPSDQLQTQTLIR